MLRYISVAFSCRVVSTLACMYVDACVVAHFLNLGGISPFGISPIFFFLLSLSSYYSDGGQDHGIQGVGRLFFPFAVHAPTVKWLPTCA